MKKLIALLMTVLMISSVTVASAGCSKPTSFGDGDDVVIQFQLDNLGFGTHWLEESCQRFMDQQRDVEYPGGKKGVYCHIVKGNTPQPNAIEQSGSHVVFRGGQGQALAETGNIWDINDVVRNMEIPGEPGVTIEDKLYPESKAYFQANNGHYYTLPAHEIYAGISYDKKLFDNYGFYFARTLNGDEVPTGDPNFDTTDYDNDWGTKTHVSTLLDSQVFFFLNEKPVRTDYTSQAEYDADVASWEKGKSCGPNGIYGDYDDGLASSLWELFAMWEFMKSSGVNPLLVSGFQQSLSNAILDSLPIALMGYDKGRTMYDLAGEVDAVVNFSYDSITNGINYLEAPITQRVNITEETGYYSTWSVENYFTMAAMELLTHEGYLDPGSIIGGPEEVNHLGAQKKFLDSGHAVLGGRGTEIGMLMEYSYWWNEASIRGRVSSFESLNPGVEDREIRWMPLPVNIKESVTGQKDAQGNDIYKSYKFTEQPGISFSHTGTEYSDNISGEKNVLVQTGWSGFIIGKKAAEHSEAESQALKDWLLFFHSDAELSAITASQGFRKGLIYEVSGEDRDKWAPFYRDLYDLSENSDILRPASTTETFKTAVTTFMSKGEGNFAWQCKHGHMFSCYRKTPNIAEDRSSRRCFIYICITKDEWAKHYKGGTGDNSLITSLTYPAGHPNAGNPIIFVDGDDSKPV